MELTRKCPKCERKIEYRRKGDYDSALRRGSLCKSCGCENGVTRRRNYRGKNNPFFGKSHTQETIGRMVCHPTRQTKEYRQNMSRDILGVKNPMYGRVVYNGWVEKYGKEEADKRQREKTFKASKQCSGIKNPMYGKPAPKGSGIGWKGWYKGWFFRSIRELSYVINVLEKEGHRWKSAEINDLNIQYINWDGHKRTYRADFLVDDKRLVEIKPKKIMNSPTNLAKKNAAIIFCENRGYEYVVEDVVPLSTEEIARLWREKVMVFTDRYDAMFRERYVA